MGRLYDLIQEHIDAQAPYPPSARRVALELGVTQTTLNNWREPKKLIDKGHLVAIARLTRNPYRVVLDALLEDIGYLHEGSGGNDERSAAPMKKGPEPTVERTRAAQLRAVAQEGDDASDAERVDELARQARERQTRED